jgi:serine/threonine protein kinase
MEAKNKFILDNKYQIIKKIGDGATANVFLCEDLSNNKIYAAKILKDNENSSNNEINSLSVIHDKNIINLISYGSGFLTKNENFFKVSFLILEYCEKRELFNYVFYPQQGFGEYFGRAIFKVILSGVDSIHKKGFAHRDLKMENIMLDKDYVVKIADFGFTISNENGLLNTPLGTLNYAAPEILMKKQYDGQKTDIFAMGVLLFTLVTCKIGFHRALKTDKYYRLLMNNKNEQYWNIINNQIGNVSNEFRDLYTKMISFKPEERPTIDEILNHPWMKGNFPSDKEILEEFEKRDKIVKKELELEELKNEANGENDSNLFRKEKGDINYFRSNIIPENFEENINNNIINLKTNLNGSEIMNKILNKLKRKYENKVNIQNNINKLEFEIIFDDDLNEDEDDNDDEDYLEFINLNIKVLLLQKKNKNEYAISFIKKEGELYDFANRVMEIKKIIKNELFN